MIRICTLALALASCGPAAVPEPVTPEPAPAPEPEPVVVADPPALPEVIEERELIVVKKTSIVILQKIFFKTNKAVIEKVSYQVLDAVAQALVDFPFILHVHVAGHSDNRGTDPYNITLTESRAHAVRNYLVSKGVEPERLSAGGYAAHCPLEDADTPEALAVNRRVDFTILETTYGCSMSEIACPDAVDAGLVPYEVRKYLPGSDYCASLK